MESHDIVGLFIVLGTAVILPITIIFRLRCGSPWIAHQAC